MKYYQTLAVIVIAFVILVVIMLIVFLLILIMLLVLLIHHFTPPFLLSMDSFAHSMQTIHGKEEAEFHVDTKQSSILDGNKQQSEMDAQLKNGKLIKLIPCFMPGADEGAADIRSICVSTNFTDLYAQIDMYRKRKPFRTISPTRNPPADILYTRH